MSAPAVSILDTIGDPALFAPWFKRPESWRAWFSFLRALFGLPMGEADVATFRACTGREMPAEAGYREAWLCVGRRGGKSLVLATIATFLSCYHRLGATSHGRRARCGHGHRGRSEAIARDPSLHQGAVVAGAAVGAAG